MLVVAFITVAAVGVFVLLQQEWRPYSLPSNIAFVAGGWLIAVSCVVYVMAAVRKGWSVVEQGLPSLNVTALVLSNGYVYVGTDNGLVRIPEQMLHS